MNDAVEATVDQSQQGSNTAATGLTNCINADPGCFAGMYVLITVYNCNGTDYPGTQWQGWNANSTHPENHALHTKGNSDFADRLAASGAGVCSDTPPTPAPGATAARYWPNISNADTLTVTARYMQGKGSVVVDGATFAPNWGGAGNTPTPNPAGRPGIDQYFWYWTDRVNTPYACWTTNSGAQQQGSNEYDSSYAGHAFPLPTPSPAPTAPGLDSAWTTFFTTATHQDGSNDLFWINAGGDAGCAHSAVSDLTWASGLATIPGIIAENATNNNGSAACVGVGVPPSGGLPTLSDQRQGGNVSRTLNSMTVAYSQSQGFDFTTECYGDYNDVGLRLWAQAIPMLAYQPQFAAGQPAVRVWTALARCNIAKTCPANLPGALPEQFVVPVLTGAFTSISMALYSQGTAAFSEYGTGCSGTGALDTSSTEAHGARDLAIAGNAGAGPCFAAGTGTDAQFAPVLAREFPQCYWTNNVYARSQGTFASVALGGCAVIVNPTNVGQSITITGAADSTWTGRQANYAHVLDIPDTCTGIGTHYCDVLNGGTITVNGTTNANVKTSGTANICNAGNGQGIAVSPAGASQVYVCPISAVYLIH